MSQKEKKEKMIKEIRFLEQNLQNIFIQKQAFQMELDEVKSAQDELKKSGDEIFKIIGQLMIKSSKDSIEKELSEKEEMINLRIKNLEIQEDLLSKKIEKLRNEVINE